MKTHMVHSWSEPIISNYIEKLPWPHLDQAGFPYHHDMFGTIVKVNVTWPHRIMLLFSGRMVVKQTCNCEHRVENLRSSSNVYTLYPMWFMNLITWWAWPHHR